MSLITKETLLMQLQRSEMASEVTLPIDSFRDLLYQAMPKEWVELTKQEYDDIYASNKDSIYEAMMVVATYLKRKNK